jgi:hypothetical protein
MPLDNSGIIEIDAGTLAFVQRGTSTGNICFDSGTTLELRGNFKTPLPSRRIQAAA